MSLIQPQFTSYGISSSEYFLVSRLHVVDILDLRFKRCLQTWVPKLFRCNLKGFCSVQQSGLR